MIMSQKKLYYKHNRLDTRLWTDKQTLHPQIVEVLIRVYIAFITLLAMYTKVPLNLEDIQDVILCGSSAGYFYHKKSDIDLKIVLRGDRYYKKMKPSILIEFFKITASIFEQRFRPQVNGMKIEISVITGDLDVPSYSILREKWLREPIMPTHADIKYLKKRASLYYCAISNQIKYIIKDESQHHKAIKLYNFLQTKRIASWDEKWKGLSPYSVAYSRVNRSRRCLIKRLLEIEKKFVSRMMLCINCNPE